MPGPVVSDGALQECINLRPEDGAWRPTGVKSYEIETLPKVRWIHRINADTYAVICESVVISGNSTIKYYVVSNGVKGPTINVDVVINDTCAFSTYNNVLSISDRVNEVTHLLVFNENDNVYIAYPGVNGQTWLPLLPSFYIYSEPYNDPKFDPYTWTGGSNISITDANAFNDLLMGEYLKHKSKAEEAGYLSGFVIMCAAWELIDGTIVMQSIPVMVKASSLQTVGFTDGTMRCTTTFRPYKLSVVFNINQDDLNSLLSKYKNIIKGVNLYTTLPKSPGLEDVDSPIGVTDINTINKRKKQAGYVAAFVDPWIAGALYRRAKKTKKIYYDVDRLVYYKPNAEDDTTYYLYGQIPIEKIIANTPNWTSFKTAIEAKDLNNLATKSIMPINQFGHHGFYGKNIFVYNQRLIYSDIKNYLFNKINPIDYIGIDIMGGGTIGANYCIGLEYDIMISSKKVCTVFTGFHSGTWTCTYADASFSTVKINLAYMPGFSYGGFIMEGYANYIGYPDARAREARLLISFESISTPNDQRTIRLVETFYLTSVPELNMAVGLGKTISKVISSLPVVQLSENPTNYYDHNRVQAAELGNPFFLPAVNSYRLQGNVLGLSSNAIALSQGQFGQFPMFAFTSEGIWAMTIGDGEVFIDSIIPLSREVCNNPGSIIGVDGGTVFTTNKGLFIVSGNQVIEIGKPAEGLFASQLSNMAAYDAIMNNINLYQVSGYICPVSFLSYISGAKIGWDYKHNEIVVSNSAYNFSWVYSVDNKTWHKIGGEVYERFIVDYPVTYGYRQVVNSENKPEQHKVDLTTETFSTLVTVHMETRPLKLTESRYKKILRLMLNSEIFDNGDCPFSMNLFGSTDGFKWVLLNSSTTFGAQVPMIIGRANFSCRYFILVAGGKIDQNSYFTGFDVDLESRYNEKLR